MAIVYKDGKPVVIKPSEPQDTPAHVLEDDVSPAERAEMSRKTFMRRMFLTSLAVSGAGATATTMIFLWPKKVGSFGSTIRVGDVAQFPPGSVTRVPDGRFYLIHTRPEEGGGFLALYWKCVHLGCTVPWREAEDGNYGGKTYKGIFRCPCHGSQYIITGQNFAGPAPRPLDTMEVQITGGVVSVNTGKIIKREQADVKDQKQA